MAGQNLITCKWAGGSSKYSTDTYTDNFPLHIFPDPAGSIGAAQTLAAKDGGIYTMRM